MISLAHFYSLAPEKSVEVWFPEDVQAENGLLEDLFKKGIDLYENDWDCLVIGSPNILRQYDTDDENKTYFAPHDYHTEELLHGLRENLWYVVTLRGQEFAVGVAYNV